MRHTHTIFRAENSVLTVKSTPTSSRIGIIVFKLWAGRLLPLPPRPLSTQSSVCDEIVCWPGHWAVRRPVVIICNQNRVKWTSQFTILWLHQVREMAAAYAIWMPNGFWSSENNTCHLALPLAQNCSNVPQFFFLFFSLLSADTTFLVLHREEEERRKTWSWQCWWYITSQSHCSAAQGSIAKVPLHSAVHT